MGGMGQGDEGEGRSKSSKCEDAVRTMLLCMLVLRANR